MEFDSSDYWREPVNEVWESFVLDWIYFPVQERFIDKSITPFSVKYISTGLNGFDLFITFKCDIPEEWTESNFIVSMSWKNAVDKGSRSSIWEMWKREYKQSMGWTYMTTFTVQAVKEEETFKYRVMYAAAKGRANEKV